MLVLTRKQDEKLLIGDDIVVTVIRTRSGDVRLGIDAPDDLLIRRLTPRGEFEGDQGEWQREKPARD